MAITTAGIICAASSRKSSSRVPRGRSLARANPAGSDTTSVSTTVPRPMNRLVASAGSCWPSAAAYPSKVGFHGNQCGGSARRSRVLVSETLTIQ
ncbi:hypothetical protein [Nonomuraea salmonea]|uniref:hypothetical protein n=1 Tax=Nonomuraea salmonea TaxID=46181 RepID=UPI002FE904EE